MDRVDDQTLRDLVGKQPLKVLRLLAENVDRPSNLRATLLKVKTPYELLSDPESRKLLLSALRQIDADRLAANLGAEGVGRAAFKFLDQLSLRKGSSKERKFFDFFDLEPETDPPVLQPRPSDAAVSYGLFPHQRDAVHRTWRMLETSPHRVLLHMPTGAGKTRTAMSLIAEFLRSNEPGLVIWLVSGEELCSQAAEEFESAWCHIGNRELIVHRFWGNSELDIDSCRDGVVIAGFNKVFVEAKRDTQFLAKLSERAGLVVMDEAHQATAETYNFVLSNLVDRRAGVRLLGLSATPGRTWNDPDADRKLSEVFARQKVTLRTEGINPVDFLVTQGYLAHPSFVPIPYADGRFTTEQLRQLEAETDISSNILRVLAEDERRNLVVVNSAEELLKDHDRVLLFAATVQHAEDLAMVLSGRGHAANVVTGTTPKGRRQQIIEAFKAASGPPQILCNYGVLTTGFDAPATSAAVIARPTKSLVLYSQMVGRALRGPQAGGNSDAVIHTVIDSSLPGFGDMGDAFLNWEDVWEDNSND